MSDREVVLEDRSAPVGAVDATNDHKASVDPRWGLVDVLVLVFAVGLCVAHGYSLFLFTSFTPRMALLFLAGFPGLLCVWLLARRGDQAGRGAAILIAWIVVAGLLGGTPMQALRGTIGRELSGLIFVLALGVWGLGRFASRRAVEMLPVALLAGLGTNAIVGVLQVLLDIDSGAFAMQFSRATGLTPSPVYFGALTAAGAALAAGQSRWPSWVRFIVVAGFGAAANLSGSRVALLAGLIAVAAVLVPAFDPMSRLRRAALPVGYLLGIGVSVVLTSLDSATRTSTDRLLGADGGGGGGRLTAWRYGVSAIADRPVLGWGLGRFRAATQARFSPDFVRTAASDDLRQAWFDAHNVLINVAVGIGVVGVVIAALWFFSAVSGVRGILVYPLIALGVTVLLQPAGLAVLPLGMLLLGSASSTARVAVRDRPPAAALAALLPGLVLAGWLAIGDLRLSAAVEDRDVVAIQEASSWFPNDAVVADVVAQSWFLRSQIVPGLEPWVIEWSERAIDAEPDRPYLLSSYAERLLVYGRHAEAHQIVDEALELQPWHLRSWQIAYVIAIRTDDQELVDDAVFHLCRLGEPLPDC